MQSQTQVRHLMRSSLSPPFLVPSDAAAEAALSSALGGDIGAWTAFLSRYPHRDGISAMHRHADPALAAALTNNQGRYDPSWLNRLGDGLDDGLAPHDPGLLLRFDAGHSIQLNIGQLLAKHTDDLPTNGFLLHVTEYLEWCLVFRYNLVGGAAQLKLLHAIEEPTSLYNVYDLIHAASNETRAIMRNVLKSRAKVVSHRGVLIHVDRFAEESVFGPSIDTLFLHEVLCQALLEIQPSPADSELTALEIGCGNGFLSCALATHIPNLKHLTYVDPSLDAVSCTARNLERLGSAPQLRHGVFGSFDDSFYGQSFDLVVANPPYVPRVAVRARTTGFHDMAVEGTELFQAMIIRGHTFLRENGALIIVYSALAEAELRSAAAQTGGQLHTLYSGKGFHALCDIEDVMSDPAWLAFLQGERGLVESADSGHKGSYYHDIRVIALTRKDETPPPGSMAHRVQALADAYAKSAGGVNA